MKELGVSQTELARRMKVSRPYITKVLHEDVNFSFRTAAKLANALKMDFFPALKPQEDGWNGSETAMPVNPKVNDKWYNMRHSIVQVFSPS